METNSNQLVVMITEAIVGVLALYNFIAPWFNLPSVVIATEQITAIVTGLVTLGLFIWLAWKNHNVTPESKLSQIVLNGLKDGVVAPEMVEEMLFDAEAEMNETVDDLNAEIEEEVAEFMESQDEIDERETESLDTRVNKGVE